ncbi:MAG: hypothetical protein AUK48_14680 [Oscillatoriales cyanobacterium CG2_30_44_21]|nr:MAG: hypothetical protein AUK48_14680 [Oscillatoriales cyanobacterium CG2_30_44_21]
MTTGFALALHTTTTKLELTIAEVVQDSPTYILHRQRSWELGRELSARLHDCLILFMADSTNPIAWDDLVFLAIATGIGSFTGTRIGVVVARTLSEQLNIPVYGVDCEAIVSWSQQTGLPQSLGESLLAIAHDRWQQGVCSSWQDVLPIYEYSEE